LKANKILGLSVEDFEKTDENLKNIIIQVAERALVARSFLVIGPEKKFQVADLVHAVVGACLFPDVTLGIDKNVPGKLPEISYYHLARKMNVLHMVPSPVIHQFMAFKDTNALLMSVLSQLQVMGTGPAKGKGGELDTAKLQEVGQLAGSGKVNQAKEILSKGFDGETSTLLAQAFEKPVANITLLRYLSRPNQEVKVDGMALLVGTNSLWDLIPQFSGNGQVNGKTQVKPTNADEVSNKIKKLLEL
jgi:hypothetical protein